VYGCAGSEQLELGLFPRVPWEGRSPRALTRAGSGFILKTKVVVGDVFFDRDQLWLPGMEPPAQREGPRLYTGAPLLLDPFSS